MTKLLDNFHKEIELLEDNFYSKFPHFEEITDCEDRIKLSCESYILNCLRGDPESSCNFVDRFDNYKDFVFSYLEERIQDTNNNRLKAKYNFALYLLKKDNKYCIESIMQYKTVVSQKSLGKYDPVAIEAVELIIKLSTKIKHKLYEPLRGATAKAVVA